MIFWMRLSMFWKTVDTWLRLIVQATELSRSVPKAQHVASSMSIRWIHPSKPGREEVVMMRLIGVWFNRASVYWSKR